MTENQKLAKQYLKDVEVSRLIGRSIGTLRNDRYYSRGIPYSRIGRSIYYKIEDVHAYLEQRKICHED